MQAWLATNQHRCSDALTPAGFPTPSLSDPQTLPASGPVRTGCHGSHILPSSFLVKGNSSFMSWLQSHLLKKVSSEPRQGKGPCYLPCCSGTYLLQDLSMVSTYLFTISGLASVPCSIVSSIRGGPMLAS